MRAAPLLGGYRPIFSDNNDPSPILAEAREKALNSDQGFIPAQSSPQTTLVYQSGIHPE
jgi:hypothetical protein